MQSDAQRDSRTIAIFLAVSMDSAAITFPDVYSAALAACDIPDGLLMLIFSTANTVCDNRRLTPIWISHVCARWGTVALNAALWAAVTFKGKAWSETPLELLTRFDMQEQCIRRTKGAELLVTIGNMWNSRSNRVSDRIIHLVLPHLHRWRSLLLHSNPLKQMKYFVEQLPRLQVPINLASSSYACATCAFSWGVRAGAPILERLSLDYSAPTFSRSPRQRTQVYYGH